MVDFPILIDDSLRELFAALEKALGISLCAGEIARVFHDSKNDQVSEKHYLFYESKPLTVRGYVEDYEPECIEIIVDGRKRNQRIAEPLIRDASGPV